FVVLPDGRGVVRRHDHVPVRTQRRHDVYDPTTGRAGSGQAGQQAEPGRLIRTITSRGDFEQATIVGVAALALPLGRPPFRQTDLLPDVPADPQHVIHLIAC